MLRWSGQSAHKIEPDKIANDNKKIRKNTNKLYGILSVGILSSHCLSWSADLVFLCCHLFKPLNHDLQAMRVPDEGKLPVSWLAGNQGEYATSTEVNKIESFVILNVKTFFVSTETNFHRLIFMLFLLGTLGPERLHASRGAWSRQDNCPVATFLSNSGQLLVTSSPFENLQCFYWL